MATQIKNHISDKINFSYYPEKVDDHFRKFIDLC